jgi:hypothetical protein
MVQRSGYYLGMKLRFSMATMLLYITVLAVVISICGTIPIQEMHGYVAVRNNPEPLIGYYRVTRPPTMREAACRFAVWGPASIAATLAVIWIARRAIPWIAKCV